MDIKLTGETLRLMALFEQVTGVTVRDCVEEEDAGRVTFVVPQAGLGKAIGRDAGNLKRLEELTDRSVDIVGFSDDPVVLLKNIFHRVPIESIEVEEGDDGPVAHLKVDPREKGKLIGRGGRNIERARTLVARLTDLADVRVE